MNAAHRAATALSDELIYLTEGARVSAAAIISREMDLPGLRSKAKAVRGTIMASDACTVVCVSQNKLEALLQAAEALGGPQP